jgi:hypothetical protein
MIIEPLGRYRVPDATAHPHHSQCAGRESVWEREREREKERERERQRQRQRGRRWQYCRGTR